MWLADVEPIQCTPWKPLDDQGPHAGWDPDPLQVCKALHHAARVAPQKIRVGGKHVRDVGLSWIHVQQHYRSNITGAT